MPGAVYNPQRHISMEGLDYYPTPPRATEILCDVLEEDITDMPLEELTCLEPAAGGGHMFDVLSRRFGAVVGRDIVDPEDRGWGGYDYMVNPGSDMYDWVITNPPFKLAEQFVAQMLCQARHGVAVLARLAFLEGQRRYKKLFRRFPPSDVYVFTERLQMVPGRLPVKSDGSSAAAYAWFVWSYDSEGSGTTLRWLPPGLLK